MTRALQSAFSPAPALERGRLQLSRMAQVGRVARGLLLGLILGLSACESEAVDATPERVVTEFIDRMQRVHGDNRAARAAYDLLWSEARHNLAERARRASAVAGREIAPEDMIAPSRFSLAFKPKKVTAREDGDWAEVTVTGEVSDQARVVKCVREDGRWRVVLELPPAPPIQRRGDGGA